MEGDMRQLNAAEIQSLIKGDRCKIFYAESVDSTNEWAKREIHNLGREVLVYLADYQFAGKGSRGRSWQSPEGTSVSMSIALRPHVPLEHVSMSTLVMGMAAAEGIHQASGVQAQIKWPNDVVCDGRKLSGILTEMTDGGKAIVIGIGINVNMECFPEELSERASSLRMITGHTVSRERVTAEIINRFLEYYEKFESTGDMRLLMDTYNDMLVNMHRQVRILDERNPYEGEALGTDELGRLLVRREDTGEIEKVFAGEVSVRGVYGYV